MSNEELVNQLDAAVKGIMSSKKEWSLQWRSRSNLAMRERWAGTGFPA